jgi:hypothetical protein
MLSLLQNKGTYNMKKSRLTLLTIIVVTLTSGILAFKSAKFTGFPACTVTAAYSTFGTIYTRSAFACLPISPARFITTTGTSFTSVYTIVGTTSAIPITLTQINATNTITFPAYTCALITNTFTTLVN